MNIHSKALSTKTKSCIGKVYEFGLNKIRSPDNFRCRGFWFYWDLSYQMPITWKMESVLSQNGKMFIKFFPISNRKLNFVEGVGVTLSCPYHIGYVQRPLVTWFGSLQYFMIKKSELHEAKKKRKTVGTQTNRSNVEEGRKKQKKNQP